MKFDLKNARAQARALGAFCLWIALFFYCCSLSARPQTPPPTISEACEGRAAIEPFTDWQASHPQCVVTATAQEQGKPPIVHISGDNCYPAEGATKIAKIVVIYPECQSSETYLVQAVNGVVEVDIIDIL